MGRIKVVKTISISPESNIAIEERRKLYNLDFSNFVDELIKEKFLKVQTLSEELKQEIDELSNMKEKLEELKKNIYTKELAIELIKERMRREKNRGEENAIIKT